MRRFFVSAVACLLAGCADRPATAIVAAVAADHDTLGVVKSIRMRAYRGTELRHELFLPPQSLDHPGTLTYRDHTDGESSDSLRFVIDGLSTPPPEPRVSPAYGGSGQTAPGLTPQAGTRVDESDPAVLVRRTARLSFVKEKSKLLRLGLSASCLGVPCEQATETCKAGRCVDDTEDPNALPDAGGDLGVDYGSFTDLPDGTGGAGGSSGIVCNGALDGQNLYVNATSLAGCSDDALCGDKDHPICSLGAAILSAKVLAGDSKHVTIHLPATTGGEAYQGSILLPAGVDLVGGYDGATWSEPPTGTTTIHAVASTTFADATVSEGTHTRSTIHVADSSAGSSVVLTNLVVEMPFSDVVTKEQAELVEPPYLTAGIHLSGSTVAKLTNVTVSGKPGVVLKESTEGVYVSSGGTAPIELQASTILPPDSQFGHSSALKIETDASPKVLVCDSTLVGGKALAVGLTSVGLRARGGSSVELQGDGCSGTKGLLTTVAGGLASTSHGVSLDAPTSLTMGPGVKVLGVQAPAGQAWPGTVTEVAAVVFDPSHTSQVSIDRSTLVGFEGSSTLTEPSNARFYGLKADVAGALTALPPEFSFTVNGATLRGVGAMTGPTDCDAAFGMALLGPAALNSSTSEVPKVTINSSTLLGGDGCWNRKGAEVMNVNVFSATITGQPETRFVGAENADECSTAYGLWAENDGAIPTEVKGGTFVGGNGCHERVGLRAAGVKIIQNVNARGVDLDGDTSGRRLVGVEVAEGVTVGSVSVSGSTMVGGSMIADETLPTDKLVYAVGLRLALDGRAEVTGNNDIIGCAPNCQGSMFAAGVRVERLGQTVTGPIVIEKNKGIIGAQFAAQGTAATEARADGILVQQFAGLTPESRGLSGGTYGSSMKVEIGPTAGSIVGNSTPGGVSLRPGAATGVTIHGGGVSVAGISTIPQVVRAGDAINSAVGVRICDEVAPADKLPCGDGETKVANLDVSGGAAIESAGVSAHQAYRLAIDALIARPGSTSSAQKISRGIWLKDRNAGIISDSYFFGLFPSVGVSTSDDRACSLELDGTGMVPASLPLFFVHNACIAGGAGKTSVGLHVDETGIIKSKTMVTIGNNVLAVAGTASEKIAWRRSRTEFIDNDQLGHPLTLLGNRTFLPANGPSGYPMAVSQPPIFLSICTTPGSDGYILCSMNEASSQVYNGPNKDKENVFDGSPPAVASDNDLFDETTWKVSGMCSELLGVADAMVVPSQDNYTLAIGRDFGGEERFSTGKVTRGPLACTGGT